VRPLLASALTWLRWRRGPVAREQRILDACPGLLEIDSGSGRQDAAA
jgi:hypothetical protein